MFKKRGRILPRLRASTAQLLDRLPLTRVQLSPRPVPRGRGCSLTTHARGVHRLKISAGPRISGIVETPPGIDRLPASQVNVITARRTGGRRPVVTKTWPLPHPQPMARARSTLRPIDLFEWQRQRSKAALAPCQRLDSPPRQSTHQNPRLRHPKRTYRYTRYEFTNLSARSSSASSATPVTCSGVQLASHEPHDDLGRTTSLSRPQLDDVPHRALAMKMPEVGLEPTRPEGPSVLSPSVYQFHALRRYRNDNPGMSSGRFEARERASAPSLAPPR